VLVDGSIIVAVCLPPVLEFGNGHGVHASRSFHGLSDSNL
jgi:hypothetical protein